MTSELSLKYESLKNQLLQFDRVVVAFSGGVDSSLLVKVAHDVLGNKATAITLVSPMTPAWDLEDAKHVAAKIGVKHILIEQQDINLAVAENTADRCYYCKKLGLDLIIQIAEKDGLGVVVEGSNMDDIGDYRPGTKALKELKIQSPLQSIGFYKAEIRELSKHLGLFTWNKPAYACLATRIPYGDEITVSKLQRIEKAESYLHSLGYSDVRVRVHGDIARIELAPEERSRFCQEETMDEVSRQLKSFGFLYVSMDLEGYKMGSLNRTII